VAPKQAFGGSKVDGSHQSKHRGTKVNTLYLLKIEPPPPELVWLPTWFFIFLMLPARIACGLALRRARSNPEPAGKWAFISRWTVRLLMPPVVGTYLLFVYLSKYVSWDGLQTWVQQHAVLVPIPFVGV